MRALGGLTLRGLLVGLAWGAFVGGVIVGFLGGLWCSTFENCTSEAGFGSFFPFGLIGGVIGAAFGLGIGLLTGLLAAIQLLVNEDWLRSRPFATVVALEVAVPCAIFLPETLFGVADENGGGLLFPAPWDAVFQILIFKVVPTLLAGFFTWRYLAKLRVNSQKAPLEPAEVGP